MTLTMASMKKSASHDSVSTNIDESAFVCLCLNSFKFFVLVRKGFGEMKLFEMVSLASLQTGENIKH